ncbi:MAG: ABC transporter permease subunit [Gammaproteobacteria bacterium]|nr:ABC transporter permease subunit [Gammaproteobacteria bacterium]MCY4275562.1 ABC transporter permease subunit [Gammaproteobacteria bacterium]
MRHNKALLVFAPFFLLIILKPWLPGWAKIPPKSCLGGCADIEGMIPFVDWVNAVINFLRKYEFFGAFTFRDITRSISGIIDSLLHFTEGLLHEGFADFNIGAIPWIALVGAAIIYGWYLRGWKLALLGGGCFFYLALFSKRGIWELSMQTLSAIAVSAPIAGLIGILVGILAAKRKSAERIIWPILNVLQSLPHFSYLIIVAIFFGVGSKAGVIATIIFAFPPMARLTLVGLQNIRSEVIEAGMMSGCSRMQMLFKVELPSARNELMLGVNQIIMQCLAMVVIASFIGQSGLGHDLLTRLQRLAIGQALEVGIAVVFIAIALDRFSQAIANKQPTHIPEGPFWKRRPYLTTFIGFVVAILVLSPALPFIAKFPEHLTISTSTFWDSIVDYITLHFYGPLASFRDAFLVYFLIPVRSAITGIPWIAIIALVACLGWKMGGWRLALIVCLFVFFIAASGYWVRAMITLYMVLVSLLICALLGIPLGIWASRRDWTTRVMQNICDTFQTFPSFIYLLPVVMLFQINDVSAIFAIIIYASIPIVRYTIFGLRNVPQEIIEAAVTSGCTQNQVLWKVRLPMAFPEIILGLNQTLMFGLFMVMIAGFIGTVDLSQEIFRALTFNDGGKGLVIGLCVSFIGLTADRLLVAWSDRQKQEYGLA